MPREGREGQRGPAEKGWQPGHKMGHDVQGENEQADPEPEGRHPPPQAR